MQWQRREPSYSAHSRGAVTVFEAAPGPARDAVVQQWLSQGHSRGAYIWRLRCAPEAGGIWAGVADLLDQLIPRIQKAAPDLISAHSYELCLIMAGLRTQLAITESLTDVAGDDERTRNFAADRAYRSLHGVIELLSEWHRIADSGPWAIACDDYDRANGLVRRFFSELVRRRGDQLGLSLLVAVAPGAGDAATEGFPASALAAKHRRHLPAADSADQGVDPDHMTSLAAALQRQVEDNIVARDVALPKLIHLWQHSSVPERALHWQVAAMHQYNHYGLYEASLQYAETVAANLDRIFADDPDNYILAVNSLYFCWVPLDQAARAREVLIRAIDRVTDPVELPRLYYLEAMLHARFLAPIDLARADELLERALALLADVDIEDREFWTVFITNGLALVRVRQSRPQEAVALCRAGVERLNAHLDPGRHRLHRSVLLYNIAQVYAQIGPFEEAIDYFGQTMAMDPNYSEYYNERGALLFKLGRLDEAEADYLRAIELSPPYPEVWINLGQCYRTMGRMADAAVAFSRSLDLDARSTLALIGRAEAYAALERPGLAIADYDRALALDANQAMVLANRAILHYEAGRVGHAFEDLDAAVRLAPDFADFYQNRAVALRDLGRLDEAAQDLDTYLRLSPDAEDREEIEDSLEGLLAAR
jgi:tetratricopeptide (TPR) repeat protein